MFPGKSSQTQAGMAEALPTLRSGGECLEPVMQKCGEILASPPFCLLLCPCGCPSVLAPEPSYVASVSPHGSPGAKLHHPHQVLQKPKLPKNSTNLVSCFNCWECTRSFICWQVQSSEMLWSNSFSSHNPCILHPSSSLLQSKQLTVSLSKRVILFSYVARMLNMCSQHSFSKGNSLLKLKK